MLADSSAALVWTRMLSPIWQWPSSLVSRWLPEHCCCAYNLSPSTTALAVSACVVAQQSETELMILAHTEFNLECATGISKPNTFRMRARMHTGFHAHFRDVVGYWQFRARCFRAVMCGRSSGLRFLGPANAKHPTHNIFSKVRRD